MLEVQAALHHVATEQDLHLAFTVALHRDGTLLRSVLTLDPGERDPEGRQPGGCLIEHLQRFAVDDCLLSVEGLDLTREGLNEGCLQTDSETGLVLLMEARLVVLGLLVGGLLSGREWHP